MDPLQALICYTIDSEVQIGEINNVLLNTFKKVFIFTPSEIDVPITLIQASKILLYVRISPVINSDVFNVCNLVEIANIQPEYVTGIREIINPVRQQLIDLLATYQLRVDTTCFPPILRSLF